MWDGQFEWTKTSKEQVRLASDDVRPVSSALYGVGAIARHFAADKSARTLKEDIIEPITSEWASPIVFAPKKGGSLQFYHDYRRLNVVTVRNSYQLPRTNDCIDLLREARISSILEADSDYWQVEFDNRNRKKATFISHHGLY